MHGCFLTDYFRKTACQSLWDTSNIRKILNDAVNVSGVIQELCGVVQLIEERAG